MRLFYFEFGGEFSFYTLCNSLGRVFNAITKTVGQFLSPNASPNLVTWNFLVESLTKVTRTMLLCMETENIDEELIITGTPFFSIIN